MGEKEFSPTPNSNASFKSASTIQSRWHLTPSWRKTLVSAAVACLVVFVFNLAITIWTIGLPYGGFYDTDSGRRIMFEGSCDESRYLNLGLHLLINVLRTIVLAASNYCMQYLSALNRNEVDRAYAKQQWLDIWHPQLPQPPQNLSQAGCALVAAGSFLGAPPSSLQLGPGRRRSQYFLALPYHFSLPLLVVSIIMHWMLSQSFFIVAVETIREPYGMFWGVLTCGYSPVAIMFVIIGSVIMILAIGITAYRRLPSNMPIVGSCSLAIAAACHPAEDS